MNKLCARSQYDTDRTNSTLLSINITPTEKVKSHKCGVDLDWDGLVGGNMVVLAVGVSEVSGRVGLLERGAHESGRPVEVLTDDTRRRTHMTMARIVQLLRQRLLLALLLLEQFCFLADLLKISPL